MKVSDALRARHSCRAFAPTPVPRETLERLLSLAAHAPSGSNTQPWQVAVLGPLSREALRQDWVAERTRRAPARPDYAYYPKDWFDPYQQRRYACGQALYTALGIKREDTAARQATWNKNYRFFDAPVALVVGMDRRLSEGSLLDVGLFLQSLMLAACEEGLGTCAQASIAEYPDRVRHHLGLPEHWLVVCGVALGYEAPEPINQYRVDKQQPEAFTQWHP